MWYNYKVKSSEWDSEDVIYEMAEVNDVDHEYDDGIVLDVEASDPIKEKLATVKGVISVTPYKRIYSEDVSALYKSGQAIYMGILPLGGDTGGADHLLYGVEDGKKFVRCVVKNSNYGPYDLVPPSPLMDESKFTDAVYNFVAGSSYVFIQGPQGPYLGMSLYKDERFHQHFLLDLNPVGFFQRSINTGTPTPAIKVKVRKMQM